MDAEKNTKDNQKEGSGKNEIEFTKEFWFGLFFIVLILNFNWVTGEAKDFFLNVKPFEFFKSLPSFIWEVLKSAF